MSWYECSEDEGGNCLWHVGKKTGSRAGWLLPAQGGAQTHSSLQSPPFLTTSTPSPQIAEAAPVAVATSNTISVFERYKYCVIF